MHILVEIAIRMALLETLGPIHRDNTHRNYIDKNHTHRDYAHRDTHTQRPQTQKPHPRADYVLDIALCAPPHKEFVVAPVLCKPACSVRRWWCVVGV